MKLAKVIFAQSVEAPGTMSKVLYLQSTDPGRKDSYRADLWLGPLGVMAGDEIYPLHNVRRITVDAESAMQDAADSNPTLAEALVDAPKRRGRPPKNEKPA